MRERLTRICIPFLAILVMAWGTCPCFYAEILSGGLLKFEVASEGDRACACHVDDGDGCGSAEALAAAGGRPGTGRCPCLDSVGTMHQFPQPDSHQTYAGDDIYLVSQPLHLRVHATPVDGRYAPSGADPGPELQSVVLLV